MRLWLALILATAISPAVAATCAPVTSQARILSSADGDDIHPDWRDGSRVGLSWSLDLVDEEEGGDGETYLFGDLIDPRGNVVTEGVYVDSMEWECDED
jgi:hypothetical protein